MESMSTVNLVARLCRYLVDRRNFDSKSWLLYDIIFRMKNTPRSQTTRYLVPRCGIRKVVPQRSVFILPGLRKAHFLFYDIWQAYT